MHRFDRVIGCVPADLRIKVMGSGFRLHGGREQQALRTVIRQRHEGRTVSTDKRHWQKAFDRLKGYKSLRSRELERELSAVRNDYLLLEQSTDNLAGERDAALESLASTERELQSLHSEFTAARQERNQLKFDFQNSMAVLTGKFEAVQSEIQRLDTQLAERDRMLLEYASERDAARDQVRFLESLLEETSSRQQVTEQQVEALQKDQAGERAFYRRPSLWMAGAIGVPLLLWALASATTVPESGETDGAAASKAFFSQQNELRLVLPELVKAIDTALHAEEQETQESESESGAAAKADKPRKRSYGKSGPSLLMRDGKAIKAPKYIAFDEEVKQLQVDLMALGFDLGQSRADGLKGVRTLQAMEEFRLLYLPEQETGDDHHLASVINAFADLAREDAKQFRIDSGVLSAIRLSSRRTGVDFAFLMELAATESNFDAASTSSLGSSAAGLYQFTHDTWLNAIKAHGDKYGLGAYASQVEYFINSRGRRRPMIEHQDIYQHVLDLRFNPRVSALIAAASVQANIEKLAFSLDREPGRTDIYLSHFLGPQGAISFLKVLDRNPERIAGEAFPRAAAFNQSIFESKSRKPRTVTEVYEIFDRKFNTERFKDWNPS